MFKHRLLDLARMEVLRRVRLKPRSTVEGSLAGPHESHYRGTAIEFADYRDYVDGDDIRLVDWKVYARTDKYYVRLYEAERNLLSYIVVDTSGSMEYSGAVERTDTKLEYACRLAAALGYLVVREGDEVGISLADASVHSHLPPRTGWNHLAAVLDLLGQARARGRTDLGTCLMDVYRRVVRRGVLIVISDFLDPAQSFWTRIDLFRRSQFDVCLFHIAHPEEVELPALPLARFQDPEGGRISFKTEPDLVRRQYRQRFAAFVAGCAANAKKRGCDWFQARTDTDPYLFLKDCFLARDPRR